METLDDELTDHLDLLPARLSPSRAQDYLQCPRLFYYKTILGMRTPQTTATLRGTLVHEACERIFDHEADKRVVDVALDYIDTAWHAILHPNLEGLDEDEKSRALEAAQQAFDVAAPGSPQEQDLLDSSRQVLRSWFDMEKVQQFSPVSLEMPDGSTQDGRELHLSAQLGDVTLHGFLDRLDRWVGADGTVYWSISDYKTGKLPRPQYQDKYWLQLRIYALLFEQIYGVKVTLLRVIFVATGDRNNGILVEQVTDATMTHTRKRVEALWAEIKKSARTKTWSPRKGPLCGWCDFQSICPAWNAGTDAIPVSTQ